MQKMILAAATLAALALAAPSRATIVDINARDSGVTLNLGAGSYTANYIGTHDGGAYNAWNAWGVVNCDAQGQTCSNGWLDEVAIDFGKGNVDLYVFDGPGNGIYQTDTQALAAYQAGPLVIDRNSIEILPTAGIGFTLASAQAVRFFVDDTPLSDNLGGVSLNLVGGGGVPEPASWALMIAGFGLAGARLRRRRNLVAA